MLEVCIVYLLSSRRNPVVATGPEASLEDQCFFFQDVMCIQNSSHLSAVMSW